MRLPGVPVRIVAAAVLLALALVGLVVREGMARAGGDEVRLGITGYDPRSVLSGHYVQFQISQDFAPDAPCPPGADGLTLTPKPWVALGRRGDHHAPTGAAATRAGALKLGDVAVRGNLTCLGFATTTSIPGEPDRGTPPVRSVTVDLGIDRLHLDQTQAEALETVLRGRGMEKVEAFAVVSVGSDGKARLKGVVVDGRRIELTWF